MSKQVNPWAPHAARSTTTKIANAKPTRVREQMKPGPVTLIDYTGAADAPRVPVVHSDFQRAAYL